MDHIAKHNLTRKALEKIRLVAVLKTDFFPQMKRQEKSTFVYIEFCTFLIMYCYAKQC